MVQIKKKLLISTILISIILMTGNYATVLANSTTKARDNLLPDFLERFLEKYGTELSEAELNKIRIKWLDQLNHNKEVIAKGEDIYEYSKTTAYLDSVEVTSPYESYGYIQYASNLEGYYDGNFAHLHTDGWNEDTEDPMGGEAFAAGYMSSSAGGNVYVIAKKGTHTGTNPPWKNIVMVYASNNINTPFLQWDFIGYTSVTNSAAAYVFVGNTESSYSCYSVICWTPAPYPDPYPYPDYFNCIQIDALYATAS